jgi:dienelactone hydrolase
MKQRTTLLAAAMCLTFGAAPMAAEPGPAPPDFAKMRADIEAYQKKPDTKGTGTYPALKEEVASLPEHVVYRPADLSKLGSEKLGVLAFGNGGCAPDGAGARFHLSEIASHGYVAIAAGKILSGPGAPAGAAQPMPGPPRAGERGAIPPPATKAEQLREAIDWALAENARQGSPYFGRINPKAIAVSGWSCGGLQALQIAASDPRVVTAVIHNSGIWASAAMPGGGSMPKEMDIGKDTLGKLHGSVLYVLGGPSDIAYANGMDDFKRIEHRPAMVANADVGHQGTFLEDNGGIAAALTVKWLNWQLKGDPQAARLFTGNDCGICKDTTWKIERKGF